LIELVRIVATKDTAKPHGKTPMQTFLDAIPIAREKMIAA
jgi:hypothetical protein